MLAGFWEGEKGRGGVVLAPQSGTQGEGASAAKTFANNPSPPTHTAKLALRSLSFLPALPILSPILSTAMPSKATLLVLLAAPCVVESAAALTAFPKIDTSMATFIASNEAALLSGSGSGDWAGAAACSKDTMKLLTDTTAEFKACQAKCDEDTVKLSEDVAAGTSSAGACLSTDECSKYKAACHEKSPNALFQKTATTIVVKDSKVSSFPKDGTWSTEYGMCLPATCSGKPLAVADSGSAQPGVTTTGDTAIADGASTTTVMDLSEAMGLKMTTVKSWSALPEGGGIVMIIIIAVVVLIVLGGIGAAVSMKGAKGGADAAVVAPAAAAAETPVEAAAEEAPAADVEAPAEE